MERRLREMATAPILLYDFMRLTLGLTKKQIRQLKYKDPGIMVNGEKKYVTYRLVPGDIVEVELEGSDLTLKPLILNPEPFEILYEDDDLIAVNKPAGVATHPAGMHQGDTLVNMLMYYFKEKQEELRVRPAGRLDLMTSGVILFSKNQVAAGRLVKQRERGLMHKEYMAVAAGCLNPADGTIHAPIRRDPENVCRVIIREDGKDAVTHYRTIAQSEEGDFSLLHVTIETGRMHQIRAHMAGTGHPLLGDALYGGSTERIGRAALHAASLSFIQPFTDQRIRVTAPLPEDMAALLRCGS